MITNSYPKVYSPCYMPLIGGIISTTWDHYNFEKTG